MQDRYIIHIALPHHGAIRDAIEEALDTVSDLELGNFGSTKDICEAEVVISDSATVGNHLQSLPESVRYLQLIDCGSGEPHATDPNLIVANSSSLLADSAANWAVEQWNEINSRSKSDTNGIAGIVGFGTLGYEIGRQLNQLGPQIWVNDIRTPRQQSFQKVGARRSSLDMLLSTSHAVFIAIHPGPTSTPLFSRRELRLLTNSAAIINLSGSQVVDKHAIKTLNTTHDRTINYREIPTNLGSASASERLQATTRYILDNLHNYALDRQPRSIVEQVTHPLAGDPAFWSSRMHPRQTPV